MMYYLDFDRTLFDTVAYMEYLKTRPGTSKYASLAAPEHARALDADVRDGVLTFEPGELSRFLYPDGAQCLRDKENAATIITFGNRFLQEAKVKSATYGIPRVSAMYTSEIRKGAHLAPHVHLHRDAVLADDSVLELEILAAECPGIRLFEVRRDEREGDGRWPVIRSLAELP